MRRLSWLESAGPVSLQDMTGREMEYKVEYEAPDAEVLSLDCDDGFLESTGPGNGENEDIGYEDD